MKYLVYTIAIIILFSVNISLFPLLKINGYMPNLLLLLLVFFAVEKEGQDFFFVALLGGLFVDVHSAVFFGSFTLAFLCCALILHLASSQIIIFELNWKYLAGVVIFSTLFVLIFVWFYNFLAIKLGWYAGDLDFKSLPGKFFTESVYNLLLFYPIKYLVFIVKQFNLKVFSKPGQH